MGKRDGPPSLNRASWSTVQEKSSKIVADNILFFLLLLFKKVRFDIISDNCLLGN